MLPDIAQSLGDITGATLKQARLKQELQALKEASSAAGEILRDEKNLIRDIERLLDQSDKRLKAAIPDAEDMNGDGSDPVDIPPDVLERLLERAVPLDQATELEAAPFSPELVEAPDIEGETILEPTTVSPEEETVDTEEESGELGDEEIERILETMAEFEQRLHAVEQQLR